MADTIYQQAGGFPAVRKVVSTFYDKILDSPDLQKYFADVDMRRLIDHQTKFIASVMGGPASFSDDALRRAHRHLNISRSEFAEIAELLRDTLEEYDFDDAAIDHVIGEIGKREELIVTRGG